MFYNLVSVTRDDRLGNKHVLLSQAGFKMISKKQKSKPLLRRGDALELNGFVVPVIPTKSEKQEVAGLYHRKLLKALSQRRLNL